MLTRRPISTDVAAIKALIDLYVPEGTLLPRSETFIAAHADDFIVAVDPTCQGKGIGVALVAAAERLARMRGFTTVFAVSNNLAFFRARGYAERHIPELDLERSEVSKYKGVYAKDMG